MGRWDDGIYDSDVALDFFAGISNRIEREIAFFMSPEQIRHDAKWLRKILTIIEIILLFERYNVGTTVYLYPWEKENPVNRWETEFFKVWDADWDDEKSYFIPYHRPDFRKHNRVIAEKLFHRIDDIITYWADDDDDGNVAELTPFNPGFHLPYFSKHSTYAPDDFVSDIITELIHMIVFSLSSENRTNAIQFWELEKVWICVDIIGILFEAYRYSSVCAETVDIWEHSTIRIWKKLLGDSSTRLDESDILFINVLVVFKRLKEVTERHQTSGWCV